MQGAIDGRLWQSREDLAEVYLNWGGYAYGGSDEGTVAREQFSQRLSQVQAAELMGYPVQQGSRGGLQSRTWQALESETDERTMQGPVFAMFLLLTGQHPTHTLSEFNRCPQ